jgi:Polyphosphate kinase N-terminal domain
MLMSGCASHSGAGRVACGRGRRGGQPCASGLERPQSVREPGVELARFQPARPAGARRHPSTPERVKSLAIVSSNLDEFFMVRVASLLRKLRAGAVDRTSIDGMTISALLAAIRQRAAGMLKDSTACWNTQLRPALADEGVRFLDPSDYTDTIRRYPSRYGARLRPRRSHLRTDRAVGRGAPIQRAGVPGAVVRQR